MDQHEGNRRSVRITARGPHAGFEIDGERLDPEAIEAYTVSQFAGEPAHVVLHLTNRGDTRFAGLARVSVADPDPGPAAAAFLSAIDAAELERVTLARPDLGTGPHSLTTAMLAQLGEWARGD
ncbi:hypothetical protein [Streptomyces sp. NPDC095613]|uniref:hypothetical protein n=1 Tax=Streptomyces sp. NPDC095613 TaxID=3155540 RepID=UPI00331925E6